ncbi:MAG TPA: shikimate kinase [Anaeromyxobacteraceae bacterium]|nr:shikimate kinase [Anaeromyxobacteraceae bacterium]
MPLASGELVALAGMMGSGKSTVARLLGRLLGRAVVSTDARIEARAGKPIAAIFFEDGEARFRALERAEVAALRGPLVVDLGGGAFCDPASAGHLLRAGKVVFLDVSAAEAARRIGAQTHRPLAKDWEPLLAARLPRYRRASMAVEVDGLAPAAVARRIADRLRAPATADRGPWWEVRP